MAVKSGTVLGDAGYGAIAGSVVPGIGTVAGGLAGAGIGLIGGLLSGPDYQSDPVPSNYPTYVGMTPQQVTVGPQFSGPNQSLNAYTQRANAIGPAPGTALALQQNTVAANQGRDQANKVAAGQAANQTAALAMHGGVGAGTQANIQKNAANTAAAGANAADASAANSRGNMLIQDANNQTNNLANAANMTNATNQQNYGMAAGDVNRQMAINQGQNAYNMNLYNTQMGAWGAGQQANATAASGKK